MKVLLTGAAGFIGMTAALRLLERGDEVVGLDNLNPYYDVQLKLVFASSRSMWQTGRPWKRFLPSRHSTALCI
jgi:nucleoside-diphosphate-sugar epimerase